MLNLVLFGPPGAGKGTQAAKLIEKYELVHLSTGDILRGEMTAGTDLGKQAKSLIEKGELVPDAIVIGMIASKLDQNKSANGFIFDGFPRTTAQAAALDKMLAERKIAVSGMIALEVEKQELINRLLNRGKTSGRADDQDVKIIENRINVYNKETSPVKDFYEKQGKYHAIDGIGTVDNIFNAICKTVDKLKK
jgi:adenylate kinase